MGATGPSGGFDIQNFFKGPQYAPQQQGQFQQQQPSSQPNQYLHQSQAFPPVNAPFPPATGNQYQFAPSAPPPPPPPQTTPAMYQGYHQYQQEQHGGRPPPYPNAPFNQAPPTAPFSQPPPQPSLRTSQSQTTPESRPSGPSNPPILPQLAGQVGAPAGGTPLDGARLMALLTTHSATEAVGNEDDLLGESSLSETTAPPAITPALPTAPPASSIPPPSRLPSTKVPLGRIVNGERIVYDVDVRNPGEAQPQLEVSPITVYGSDPLFVQGRQIAVNKNYICYGLRQATIRILNINTALKALLRGHSDRISDMAFHNENSNLLASASTDGRVIVRLIAEGRVDEKILISENIVVAIQFDGDWVSQHPRLCWHSHVKDLLVVAIGKYVVSIDLNRARAGAAPGGFSIDQPALCTMENPLEGVTVVGVHHDTVSDLAITPYSSTRILSASQDGTVQVWGDKKRPVSAFTPHQGEAVGTVAFLSSPRHPEHSVLLTAGPLNREIKLWAPEPDNSQARSNSSTWMCLQTLEFDSSTCRGKLESAFFNQVVIAQQGGLILVANAKRNAIYSVHVDFGSSPTSARMDYIAEFSVTMPILSLTIVEENVTEKGNGTIQIYCVQTQAIQQYPLPVVQCLPPEGWLKQGPSKSTALDLPTSASLTEKVGPNMVNKANQPLPTFSGSLQTAGTVQRTLDRHNSAGFGDLLDEASAHREMVNAMEGQKASDPRKTMYTTTQVTQPVPERVMQTSTIPTSQRVPLPESGDPGPPPPINIGRAPSQTAKEQRYVPVSTGQRQQADSSLDNRGRYNPPAPEKVEHSTETRRYSPASPGLARQVDDARENQQYSPGSVHHVSEKMEGSGENWTDSAVERVGSLERSDSETSSNSQEDDSLDKEDASSNQTSIQKQTGPIPTHLITPSELMSLAAGTKQMESESETGHLDDTNRDPNISAKAITNKPNIRNLGQSGTGILDLDASLDDNRSESSMKVETGSTMDFQDKGGSLSQFDSLASEYDAHDAQSNEDTHRAEEAGLMEERDMPVPADDIQEQFRDMVLSGGNDNTGGPPLWNSGKVPKKNKNKTSGVLGSGMPQLPPLPGGMPHSQASFGEGEANSGLADLAARVTAMQDSISNLISIQNELQKQMTVMVAVPVAKEGKRMESALGQRMEKVLKAHVDAMWARVAEENAKREKLERERVQQINTLVGNLVLKDMPTAVERGVKKEFSALGPTVTQAVLPPLQKAISMAVTENFQKGISEKVVPQLEKVVGAKLEANLGRQLQTQFQTTGKQALQETLRSCLEVSLVPAFERSCQEMFMQVDGTFQRGMADHTAKAQQQFASSHSTLATTLKDAVTSASNLAESLKVDLAESHKKLVAYVENTGANAAALAAFTAPPNVALPDQVLSLERLEESLDPTVKLGKLVVEGKLEEAFTVALSSSDVTIVSWLCEQVDPQALFAKNPLPLSQGVLLSLVQQLGCDLANDTANKLTWIREAALALNLADPVLAPHMRPFLHQLYQNLHSQMVLTPPTGEVTSALRLVIHVVNSLLSSCK